RLPASGAPRHLDEELERALRGAEVGDVEREVGEQHGDERDAGDVVALAHHLRADEDVRLAGPPRPQDPALRARPPRGVAVEAVDRGERMTGAERRLDLLRSDAERLEPAHPTLGTHGRRPPRVAAVVTDER